jgi:hypothetical protein
VAARGNNKKYPVGVGRRYKEEWKNDIPGAFCGAVLLLRDNLLATYRKSRCDLLFDHAREYIYKSAQRYRRSSCCAESKRVCSLWLFFNTLCGTSIEVLSSPRGTMQVLITYVKECWVLVLWRATCWLYIMYFRPFAAQYPLSNRAVKISDYTLHVFERLCATTNQHITHIEHHAFAIFPGCVKMTRNFNE